METDLAGLNHREALGYWLNERGLTGTGVEVGSAFGQFASRVLSQWKGKQLFMVDPWEKQPPNSYLEGTNDTAPFEEWYQQCQKIAENDNRAMLLKKLSVAAAVEFPLGSLDWVYIDGNHSFGHVMQDLDAWHPKVKLGGLVGGHDFYNNTEPPAYVEVEKAVMRWTKEHNVTFTVTPCTSWWFIKW